jgi:phosphoribosylaminoimidazole-succinocarboxamide synthase
VVREGMPANPSCFNVVRRFPVMHPPQRVLLGSFVFDYAQFHQSGTYVVPLEYIVRFGVTSGSSILKKYQSLSDSAKRAYEQELGLSKPMGVWEMLERPIYDLTSKYEPEDRAVSKQEALLMSGLSSEAFLNTVKMSILGGWAVRELLESAGLLLWDLKWEFAVDGDELLFVDTIDADSFRGTGFIEVQGRKLVIHYNKQAMRDYYRLVHPEWFAGINDAKKEAQKTGVPFKQMLREGQAAGKWPATPVVDAVFLDLQARKTALIRDHVLSLRSAAEIRADLEAAGRAETAFYEQKGLLDALLAMNATA